MPDNRESSRPEKKSETIETRLPFNQKRAFLARCRAEGKSASEVLRRCIEDYLASPTQPERKARQTMMILKYAASLAAVAGSVALVHHGAHAEPDHAQQDRAHFAAVDSNGDGGISREEMLAAHESATHLGLHGRSAEHASAEQMAALHAGMSPERHRQLAVTAFAAAAGADGLLAPEEMSGFHARIREQAAADR